MSDSTQTMVLWEIGLATRVVIPLMPAAEAGKPLQHLNPVLKLGRRKFLLATSELAGIPLSALGDRAGSMADQQAEIIAAPDFLITGIRG